MHIIRGLSIGATIALLIALLLCAGCTQPTGITTGTPAPTPTASPVPTKATSASTPTVNVTANVTANLTALKTDLAALAGKFAGQVNGTLLVGAARDGPNSTAFEAVQSQLQGFRASDPRLVYVYTLGQQNGTVRFVVDASYGTAGGSGWLEDYPDAPAVLDMPLTAPVGTGPYTDSYGTFISGFAPINATGANGTTYVLGVDMKA